MAYTYIGNVTGLITYDDLYNTLNLTSSKISSGDIDFLKYKTEEGRIILMSSRHIDYGSTWDSLNLLDLIIGKELIINGKRYLCRVPRGAKTDPTPITSEGVKDSELTKIYDATPNPSTMIIDPTSWTMCKETEEGRNDRYLYRYLNSNSSAGGGMKNSISSSIRFRVILEFLNAPHISIPSEDLGNITNFTQKNYNVTCGEDTVGTFTLTEKLNGVVMRTLSNQSNGTSYTLDLSSQWDGLVYGGHKLEVIATDPNGLSNTVNIRFNKVKIPIQKLPVNSTLIQSANFNKEILSEMEYQNLNLYNILKSKGVVINDIYKNKLSKLIDVVNTLELERHRIPKWFGVNDIWINRSLIPELPFMRYFLTSSMVDGKIYCIGGEQAKGVTMDGSNQCYDTINNKWSQKSKMPTPRLHHGSTVVNSKIYSIGGVISGGAYSSKNECYDPSSDIWSSKLDNSDNLGLCSCISVNTNVYCLTTKNYCYDSLTNTWSTKTSPSNYRYGSGLAVINGMIYALGSSDYVNRIKCERYNPTTDTWSSISDMPTDGRIWAACQSDGVNIYVIGGGSSTNSIMYNLTQCYNTVNNTWSTKSAMQTSRQGMGSAIVNGNIYIWWLWWL